MQLVKFTLTLAILAVLVSSAPVPSSNDQDLQSNVHVKREMVGVDYNLPSKQAEKRRKDFAQVSPLDPVAAAFTGIRPGTLVRPGSGNAWKNGIKNSVKAVGNAVRKIFRG